MDYIRMLYLSYGSVCELETQILSAGDLDFIEKGERGRLKKDIAEIERMLNALIKSLEKNLESLTPGILGSSSPTKLEKNQIFLITGEELTRLIVTYYITKMEGTNGKTC